MGLAGGDVRKWSNVLPRGLAQRQTAWERRCRIVRAHDAGVGFVLIGEKMGIGHVRVAQLYHHQKWLDRSSRRAPILEYFECLDLGISPPAYSKRAGGASPAMVRELNARMDAAERLRHP